MAHINSLTGVLKYIGAPDGSSDSNRNLDAWYGPYENISEALQLTLTETNPITQAVTTVRYKGMTVGIYNATGGVDEYWFKNGIEDDDLIPKIPDIVFPTIDQLPGNIKVAKFDANGGVGHQNSELTDGQSYIHLPACVFTNASGTFQGWDTTTASQNPKVPGTDVLLSQSTTFYAIWDNIIPFTVNFDDTVITCTLNGATIPNGSSVASGSTVVFTYANTAADKTFSSWTGFQTADNVSYGHNPETATIQVTRTLNIDCVEDTLYQLTIHNILSHGSLTLDVNTTGAIPAPSSIWLAYGSVAEIEYTANTTGWSISDWQCTGVNPTSSTDTVLKFTMPSNNVNVSPQEQQASTSFTIRFYEDDNDQSSYIGYYSSSSPVTLQAAVSNMIVDGTQPSCFPVSWAEFGATTPIADTDVLSGDTSLYIFAKQYQVTVTPSPLVGGTCTGGGLFNQGGSTTLSATPSNGYNFTNWTLAGSPTIITDNPMVIQSITQNMSYLANFTQINYIINVQADPTEGGTVSGTGIYHYNDTATLTATANTGYVFSHWDNNASDTNPNKAITVTQNESHVAHFTEAQPDQVNTIELSGMKKYASNVQDRIDNGTITSTQYTRTVGQENTVTIVRNNATNDTKGYSVLLSQGYKVNESSVHFYDPNGNEFDKIQYQVTCTHGLPSSSADGSIVTQFTYNGGTYQGYFMSLDANTPTTVKFTIELE